MFYMSFELEPFKSSISLNSFAVSVCFLFDATFCPYHSAFLTDLNAAPSQPLTLPAPLIFDNVQSFHTYMNTYRTKCICLFFSVTFLLLLF